jgi:hypothetical protein
MAEPGSDEAAAELATALRRAGIALPAERWTAVLALYVDLREQMALLHGRHDHRAEPANVYRLQPGTPR